MSALDASTAVGAPIDLVDAAALIGAWWFAYDEGDFAAVSALLAEDVHFVCRTDSGTSAIEEFVRADVSGRDEVWS